MSCWPILATGPAGVDRQHKGHQDHHAHGVADSRKWIPIALVLMSCQVSATLYTAQIHEE
jgi:hypothetical protein